MNARFLTLAACIFMFSVSIAAADTFTFTAPAELLPLDHHYAYEWGIQWSLPTSQSITEANLTITGIDNWASEPNVLHMRLLDNGSSGTGLEGLSAPTWDNQNPSDVFVSRVGIPIADYNDLHYGSPETLTFNFSTLGLVDWLAGYVNNNSHFSLSFDPDCHYSVGSIALVIETQDLEAPEPGTIFLLSSGLIGLALAAWRRRK